MAVLLEVQRDNPFRVAAYRRAVDTVARLLHPLRDIHGTAGTAGLDALPGTVSRNAAAIGELLTTGSWTQLARLRGAANPDALFRTIPSVGPELAHRLHGELEVDTIEALEVMARDGRLETVPGIGARRAASIRAALTEMLDRQRRLRNGARIRAQGAEPPIDMLLAVDLEYRTLAEAGNLPKIAPKRFNPEGAAWLPVLHTEKPGWHFTALHSNTARDHERDRAHDWVVLYGEDAAHREHQFTAVTAGSGSPVGRRIVLGREAECRQWYARDGAARA
jgi:hypothetical protein